MGRAALRTEHSSGLRRAGGHAIGRNFIEQTLRRFGIGEKLISHHDHGKYTMANLWLLEIKITALIAVQSATVAMKAPQIVPVLFTRGLG